MLKLNERFKIESTDEFNYSLYELTTIDNGKKKRLDWKHIGYFGKISHALRCAFDKHIKTLIEEQDFTAKELLERIQGVEKDLESVDIIIKEKKEKKR